MEAKIIASLSCFIIGLAALAWVRKFRKKHESYIEPPRLMPKRSEFRPEDFTDYSPEKIVWKAAAARVQPVGSVECLAYSLRSLIMSPPFRASDGLATNIQTLFKEISRRDDQKSEEGGLNPVGAMKFLEDAGLIGRAGFFTKWLRRLGFRHAFFNFSSVAQVAEFVAGYAPVIGGMPVGTNPRIDGNCLYAMEGDFAFYHSIYIYGIDRARVCPDGSTGAFRVRWHLDWAGDTDGWLSFALAEKLLVLGWTYGWRD